MTDDRDAFAGCDSAMMANGVICSPQGLGCLSTSMTTAEVDRFVRASEAALTALRERFGAD